MCSQFVEQFQATPGLLTRIICREQNYLISQYKVCFVDEYATPNTKNLHKG